MPLSAKLKMQKEIDARNEARELEYAERMKKSMDERDITIVLKALADKIRMLEWENECLRKRNDELNETLAKLPVND